MSGNRKLPSDVERFDAFDPDEKIMWSVRVHAGVMARMTRLAAITGLTMSDILTIAVAEVEKNDTFFSLVEARKRTTKTIKEDEAVAALLRKEMGKMRASHTRRKKTA